MALADIAHIGDAGLRGGGGETSLRHHAHCLGFHFGQQRVHRGDIETRKPLIQAANNLVTDWRAQKADGAADAGAGGHENAGNADLLGDPAGMHRTAAAEGDQGAALIGFARLDRVDAGGVGHVLVDHFHHRQRRHRRVQPERAADFCRQGVMGGRLVQLHGAAGEARGIVAAERQVGIRHRRVRPTTAVAGRARIGAGTFRADADAPQAVHLRDGAAAGADLHHLDHRDAQRQAGALAEAADPGDLEAAGGLRLVIVDQADLRRGAAHVEGQHVGDPALAGDIGGEDRPAGRPAFHQADREAAGGVDRGQAAAGQHQEDRRGHAHRGQIGLETAQIARHHRLHVGVRGGGGEALPFAHLGRHLRGQRNRHAWQFAVQDVAHPALMHRVDEGVQQADGDALDRFAYQQRHQGTHRVFVQRAEDVAFVVEAFGHRQAQMAGHQRLGQDDVEVVLVVAALVAHRQHVAKPLGGDQGRSGTLALDQRVGGQRGAVHDQRDIRGGEAGGGQDRAHTGQHALLGG